MPRRTPGGAKEQGSSSNYAHSFRPRPDLATWRRSVVSGRLPHHTLVGPSPPKESPARWTSGRPAMLRGGFDGAGGAEDRRLLPGTAGELEADRQALDGAARNGD